MSLSIIIPTWNNAELTCECLRSLETNTQSDFDIVWIDNGSTDEQYEQVAAAIKGFAVTAQRYDHPLGFARAVNHGLAQVRGDYGVILNNDVTVSKDWDVDLKLAVDDKPGIAGPVCINSIGWQDTRLHPWLGIPEHLAEDNTKCAEWLQAQWSGQVIDIPEQPSLRNFRNMLAFFCVLMPKQVLQTVGELDENFGWGYCEDDDYCHRARLAGYSLTLCPGSSVVHRVGSTLAQVQEDHQQRLKQNQHYLAEKWGFPEGRE